MYKRDIYCTKCAAIVQERDIEELDKQGGYYINHVLAMTDESLRLKCDIAAELAYRDYQMVRMRKALLNIQRAYSPYPRLQKICKFALDDSTGKKAP